MEMKLKSRYTKGIAEKLIAKVINSAAGTKDIDISLGELEINRADNSTIKEKNQIYIEGTILISDDDLKRLLKL